MIALSFLMMPEESSEASFSLFCMMMEGSRAFFRFCEL
jgi:hypothetical protein